MQPQLYTREQLLEVRHQIQLKTSARDFGIAKKELLGIGSRNTPSGPLPDRGSLGPKTSVAVVKKKAKSVGGAAHITMTRAVSAGDAMSAAGYYSTRVAPLLNQSRQAAATAATTTAASASGDASAKATLSVWDQRKLRAAEIKAEEEAATKAAVKEEKKQRKKDATISSSPTMTIAEEYVAAAPSSSFSDNDRAKLAQLREHLKNRTLASQLRPVAAEFRPSKDPSGVDQDPSGKKHWSRDWVKGLNSQKEKRYEVAPPELADAAAPADTQVIHADTQMNSVNWAQRARTVPPSLSKRQDPNAAAKTPELVEGGNMTVVGSNEISTDSVIPKHQINSQKINSLPAKQRVPCPRTIGQLRQRNEEDLPVDFRDLIPTTDISGDPKPMDYMDQVDKMRDVARLLVNKGNRRNKQQIATLLSASTAASKNSKKDAKNMKAKLAAATATATAVASAPLSSTSTTTTANGITTVVTQASSPQDLVNQLNARSFKQHFNSKPPTFLAHNAERLFKSDCMRPKPGTRAASSYRATLRSMTGRKDSHLRGNRSASQADAPKPTKSLLPVTKSLLGNHTTLSTKPDNWSKYIPDMHEFPADYAALFADWSFADIQAEMKLHRVTEDVKLLEGFHPDYTEVVCNPQTGAKEEYTMMWVEGCYTQIAVSTITPELIRKSQEAAKVYAGVDSKNLSLKRAFIEHKRSVPAERRERRAARLNEVKQIRKKIGRHLEGGLNNCDRKAGMAVPLGDVLRDPRFSGLSLIQKCEICRARRIRFLKTERLCMVEKVAFQHSLAVLDVIAVLHSMMDDRLNLKIRKQRDLPENDIKFARMLAKRDAQVKRIAQAKAEEAATAIVIATPEKEKQEEQMSKREKRRAEKGLCGPKKSCPQLDCITMVESEDELRKRVVARKKHLAIAMRTPGYQIWLKVKDLTNEKYKVEFEVNTPVPEQLCSKRAWDGLVRQWRQRLHQYDSFALEVLNRPIFAKAEMALHQEKGSPKLPSSATIITAQHVTGMSTAM